MCRDCQLEVACLRYRSPQRPGEYFLSWMDVMRTSIEEAERNGCLGQTVGLLRALTGRAMSGAWAGTVGNRIRVPLDARPGSAGGVELRAGQGDLPRHASSGAARGTPARSAWIRSGRDVRRIAQGIVI